VVLLSGAVEEGDDVARVVAEDRREDAGVVPDEYDRPVTQVSSAALYVVKGVRPVQSV